MNCACIFSSYTTSIQLGMPGIHVCVFSSIHTSLQLGNPPIWSCDPSENGDFNRGLKSFQANTMLKFLTRATEKTKRSWIYMRENGVDSPYLFLHCVFSIDASAAHP